MLLANILAELDVARDRLELQQRDLKRVDNLLKMLQDRKARIAKDISDLEYKISELEDELDDNS